MSTHSLCFGAKIRIVGNPILHGHVIMMSSLKHKLFSVYFLLSSYLHTCHVYDINKLCCIFFASKVLVSIQTSEPRLLQDSKKEAIIKY